jgi:hypothetical protein
LGSWVGNQRHRQHKLGAEGKARLDALGFKWNARTSRTSRISRWENGFQHLEAFVKEHGHCKVVPSHLAADGFRLGVWVSRQRTRQDSLSAELRERLDALGFKWNARTSHISRWEKGFHHLEAFVKEHGHCRVPISYVTPDKYRLGSWVGNQRSGQASLSADRKATLDALGFVWSSGRTAPVGDAS